MLKFYNALLKTPQKKLLASMLTLAVSTGINHLTGPQGQLSLPKKLAIDICLLMAGLVFSLFFFSYHFWKKSQPMEKITWAKQNGKFICQCTEIGTIMLLLPKPRSGESLRIYECPKCKSTELVSHTIHNR